MKIDTPSYEYGAITLPAVDAAAARDTAGTIHLALVNVDPHHGATVSVRIDGTDAHSARGEVLTAAVMDAHNTFSNPHAIQPAPFEGARKGDRLVFHLPPMCVAVVALH